MVHTYVLSSKLYLSMYLQYDTIPCVLVTQDGYIMSSSRGNSGETTWSKCSRRTLLDQLSLGNSLKCIFDEPSAPEANVTQQTLFDGKPGQAVSPDEQCRIFLKAFTAISVDNGDKRCQVLLCKYRSSDASIFLSGPALEGIINCPIFI